MNFGPGRWWRLAQAPLPFDAPCPALAQDRGEFKEGTQEVELPPMPGRYDEQWQSFSQQPLASLEMKIPPKKAAPSGFVLSAKQL